MKIARTPRAIEGFREVSSYIAHNFGVRVLREFQLRTKEWTKALKQMPKLGSVDEEISTEEREYRSVTIYRRSVMEYRIIEDTILIVDFYDTRRSVTLGQQYE